MQTSNEGGHELNKTSRYECPYCKQISEPPPKITRNFMGFRRIECPACKKVTRYPLTVSYLAFYWIVLLANITYIAYLIIQGRSFLLNPIALIVLLGIVISLVTNARIKRAVYPPAKAMDPSTAHLLYGVVAGALLYKAASLMAAVFSQVAIFKVTHSVLAAVPLAILLFVGAIFCIVIGVVYLTGSAKRWLHLLAIIGSSLLAFSYLSIAVITLFMGRADVGTWSHAVAVTAGSVLECIVLGGVVYCMFLLLCRNQKAPQ